MNQKRPSLAMQKVIFWLLKGGLLQGKRLPFIKHWETRTYKAVQHTVDKTGFVASKMCSKWTAAAYGKQP